MFAMQTVEWDELEKSMRKIKTDLDEMQPIVEQLQEASVVPDEKERDPEAATELPATGDNFAVVMAEFFQQANQTL